VLLGHPKSFGMGLNLQGACRTMIHYSPMYSGDRYRQVIGRIHRRGQSHTVTRVSFYAPGTVEERTISALAKKEHDEAEFMLHVGK
jgi:SNF2 family DNA or RNA helicase